MFWGLGPIILHAQGADRLGDIRPGQDRLHPRIGLSGADIDGEQPSMRVGAAHKRDPEGTGQVDIIDILALTQQHPRVFDPFHLGADHLPRADRTRGHGVSSHCVSSRTIARLYLEVKAEGDFKPGPE